jgi:hypothetical protein
MDYFFVMPVMMCLSMGFNGLDNAVSQLETLIDRIPYSKINRPCQELDVMAAWFVSNIRIWHREWITESCKQPQELVDEIQRIVRKWVILDEIGFSDVYALP